LLNKRNYLITIISISLVLGFLYYYFLRDLIIGFSWMGIEKVGMINTSWSTYFLWFPTFIHPFIFSLLSWWATGFTYPKASVSFWLIVNLLAELGQGMENSFFNNFPTILKHYFQYGTFDYWDMLSIVLGAFFAYIVILKLKKGLV